MLRTSYAYRPLIEVLTTKRVDLQHVGFDLGFETRRVISHHCKFFAKFETLYCAGPSDVVKVILQ